MITMLYEKTLSRKVVGTCPQSQEAVNSDEVNDGGPPMETKRPNSQVKNVWESLCGAMKRLLSTANESPKKAIKSASMGRILNMMRHAYLTVLLFVSQLI